MQDFATGQATAMGGSLPELTRSYLIKIVSPQVRRIMRLTAILLLTACLHVSAEGVSQTVTLSEKNAPLVKVMKAIEQQTGYAFFYKSQWLVQAKKVTIEAEKIPLQQALYLCFKDQPFTYVISGKNISIEPKEGSQKEKSRLIDVKGRVTDSKGQPVAGATILVQGTKKSTITDADGSFSLTGIGEDAVIIISHVQYELESITLNGHSIVNATLQVKISPLDEMQVIAYGTTSKRLNTGNVSTVKAADIETQPINNPLLALQGRVPGLFITQSSGLPGAGVTVRIRGQNSIQNGNDPLYIIDGIPYSSQNLPNLGSIWGSSGSNIGGLNGNPLSYINPMDIESIDVLKDADATAIYGSRGANGVILITTKRGKNGKLSLNINTQNGWGKVTRMLELLNIRQYLDMRNEAFQNDGAMPQSWDYDLVQWDTTRSTDWQKKLIGGTAHYNDFGISISGSSNNNTQFLIGYNYHRETSVFPGDHSNKKASMHFNISSSSLNKKFHVSLSGMYLANFDKMLSQDLTSLATSLAPNAPKPYNENGTLNWEPDPSGFGTWENPMAYLSLKFKNNVYNFLSNVNLSYQVLPGLEVKGNLGFTNLKMDQSTTVPLTYYDPSYWNSVKRSARFVNNNSSSFIIEPQITYSKRISSGTLNILLGTTIQQNNSKGETFNASGYNSDLVLEDIKSASSVTVGATTQAVYKYNAFFGRINYNWKDKYLINLSARRDGTSRFGPENRFNNFTALGAGWIFSEENLFSKNLTVLSFGKIRGSYGITGSDQVGDYSFMDLYNPTTVGNPYQGSIGLQISNLYSPDLAWEETKKIEGGIELGFLKNRILLSASFYSNRSTNQLTGYTLSTVTGFSNVRRNLPATVQNSGWEFSLNTTNVISKKFKWNSVINLSINRNKLVSVSSGMSNTYQRLKGLPLGTQFVYHLIGVDPETGVYQFNDGSGNTTFNPDTSFLKSSYPINTLPKFFGGFQNSISYKGFQLDILFQFIKQIGRNYLLGNYPGQYYGGGYNQPVSVLNRWRKVGDVARVQKFNQDYSIYQTYNSALSSDAAFSDASFIRLKNVSFSWTLPKKLISSAYLNNCKIFLQGQNVLTITNYEGMDPENQSISSLPPLRIWTFGLQANF